MRGLILSLASAALILGANAQTYGDTTLTQTSGRQKPVVAVLPVIDETATCNLPWDISLELTDEIRNRVYCSKRISLLREGGSLEAAKLLSSPNPYTISRDAVDALGNADFVVVAEIVKQDEKPAYGSRSERGAVLSSVLRVRVLDVRKGTPKVILQEIVDNDYVVAKAYMNCDYSKMAWGTEAFSRTPMGVAHNQLVREVVGRIESYIGATQ